MTDKERVPKDYKKVEAYYSEKTKTLVLLYSGEVYPPPEHNCDYMGCGSLDHVWKRIKLDKKDDR